MRPFLLFLNLLAFSSFAQNASKCRSSKSIYFDQAFTTIKNMLEGKIPISFKQAVFLTENAYRSGNLNWQQFDGMIKNTVPVFQDAINHGNYAKFKTAKNWAVHMYIVDTNSTPNHYQRFNYDYETYANDTIGFVSNLLNTHLGNCHSLPYLYKVFCDEIGAECHLALAPMHVYIMQQDEYGEWWNIELTSRYRYLQNSDIITGFNITPVAKKSGLYMKPLSDRESLVLCIEDLLLYYHKKFDKKGEPVQDLFVQKCFQLGLKYKPASELLLDKFHYYKYQLDTKMKAKSLKEYRQISGYQDLEILYTKVDGTAHELQEIGYKNFDQKLYKAMVKNIEEKKKKFPKYTKK